MHTALADDSAVIRARNPHYEEHVAMRDMMLASGEKPHRWVVDEPYIPVQYTVLYEDERIIVIDKPHFLAATPRGMWYRQTALIRLREQYDEPDITPAHRLDRMTAGVMVFVRQQRYRRPYQMLFQEHRIVKTYECLAPSVPVTRPRYGTIVRVQAPSLFPLLRRSRIVKERGTLQAFETSGLVNAETLIELSSDQTLVRDGFRSFVLHPHTGKTHQLRVHMNSLGMPIAGDDFYPRVDMRNPQDFSEPLQLVARSLSFVDPIDGTSRCYISQERLQ